MRSPVPVLVAVAGTWLLGMAGLCHADVRLRDVLYSADEVYRLPAYAGYDTDIEFQAGERFVGLGTGDLRGIAFRAQDNHLFIKPTAADVRTDITVLTDRRVYHFEFIVLGREPDDSHADLLYALRFLYPAVSTAVAGPRMRAEGVAPDESRRVSRLLSEASGLRAHNTDYWYCGAPQLQPSAAWDDGVQTHLRFSVHQEMPAVFLRNEDGSESLLNFHIEHEEIVIHRVARRLLLRRGGLTGCIVNRAFTGGDTAGEATISPQVRRDLRGGDDE